VSDCKIYCELVRLAQLNSEYTQKIEKENILLIKQNAIYKAALEKLKNVSFTFLSSDGDSAYERTEYPARQALKDSEDE
jgi:hypothetical protein